MKRHFLSELLRALERHHVAANLLLQVAVAAWLLRKEILRHVRVTGRVFVGLILLILE